MGAAKKLNHKKVLRDFIPINALSEVHVEEVTRKVAIEQVRDGRYVFRKGDRDYQSVYLLEGSIELIGGGRDVVSTVEAGSVEALHPLAHKQPRQLSARASGKVTVARIDSRLLDVLLTWDESAGYDVVEIDANDDDDWMTRMLQSQAFLQLPPSNIHQLLMRLESVNVGAGEVVIRQGEEGEYFYIVKNGRIAVTRKASARAKEVLLAELGEGACFGEDALVSETKRSASVTMLSDGLLMRLSKDDFNELLRAPLVHEVDFAKAQELVSNGAQWVDVRLPGEFENQAIKGSTNLPLSALREQCADLDSSITYILCCDTGRRSSAGAFVLSQRGFNIYTLKNGLGDVPDEALSHKASDEPDKEGIRDAEIIPFDADSKSSAESSQPPPVDTALIEKQALLEKEKISLQQQLNRAEQQSAEAKAALEAAESRYREEQSGSLQLRQEIDKLHSELQSRERQIDEQLSAAEQEEGRLQADLDSSKQEHDKQSRELEQELGQLRSDYQALGQRSNAAAGERDAAVRDSEQTKRDLAAIQEQLSARHVEASEQQESLQKRLEQREHELEEEKNQRQSLEQQAGELEDGRKALEQQIQSLTERADAGQSRSAELESQLADNVQKMQALEQSLKDAGAREQSIQDQLQQAEQKSAEELEAVRSETSAQQAELNEHIAALQLQLDDQNRQLQQQQSEREELEQKLGGAQQSLDGAVERERQIAETLRQKEEGSGQIREALDQSAADADEARKERDEAKQQLAGSETRVSELDKRLNSIEKEHASDIASLREALTRAQDERENVSREQTRLMGGLRKAERDLELERNAHDTEVRRLRKKLKEAAGESNAGLATELDAAQEQLRQGARQYEDLEIQLGERSAQMENAQAEAEKLSRQLELAQESARQAEQQLIEANQAANEEMAIRLDAEQQAQQALREQLDAAISERNQNQEQLTVQNHELEELREAVQQARAEVVENSHGAQALQEAEQQVQDLREAAQQLEQARSEAGNLYQQAQQEVDRLRAEAEVSRGLVTMQASMGDSDEALRAELVEHKKNADVAVRLRIQAEKKSAGLQQEVERLQAELNRSGTIDGVDEQEVRIPSLDENDPQASALLNPEFDEPNGDTSRPEEAGDWAEEGEVSSPSIEVAAETGKTGKTGGSKILPGMLLTVALAAGGGYWWFSQNSSLDLSAILDMVSTEAVKGPRVDDISGGLGKVQEAETEPQEDPAAVKTSKPATLPSFARGMSEPAIPAATEKAAEPEAPEPEIPAETKQEDAEKPATGLKDTPIHVQTQPVRSFRETLSSGGAAPTIVEFRADSFAMGSSSASPNFAERPRHRVGLKRFAIAKHEITFAQYDQFAQASGRSKPNSAGWGRGSRPVINVSWQDAVAYTRWLSDQTGSRYRLPTEAEWEFAARSGGGKRFWWGNDVGEANANCFDCGSEWSGSRTAPVGSFPVSPFAVHDMAGNVMEWVQDCYRSGYADAPDDGSAVELAGCEERVVRGGAYDSPADLLRSASRSQRSPEARLDNLGFRVVREF